jgi:hypothetical protein
MLFMGGLSTNLLGVADAKNEAEFGVDQRVEAIP